MTAETENFRSTGRRMKQAHRWAQLPVVIYGLKNQLSKPVQTSSNLLQTGPNLIYGTVIVYLSISPESTLHVRLVAIAWKICHSDVLSSENRFASANLSSDFDWSLLFVWTYHWLPMWIDDMSLRTPVMLALTSRKACRISWRMCSKRRFDTRVRISCSMTAGALPLYWRQGRNYGQW